MAIELLLEIVKLSVQPSCLASSETRLRVVVLGTWGAPRAMSASPGMLTGVIAPPSARKGWSQHTHVAHHSRDSANAWSCLRSVFDAAS